MLDGRLELLPAEKSIQVVCSPPRVKEELPKPWGTELVEDCGNDPQKIVPRVDWKVDLLQLNVEMDPL